MHRAVPVRGIALDSRRLHGKHPIRRRRKLGDGQRRSQHAAPLRAAQRSQDEQSAFRLRPRAVRRVHRASGRRAGALLRDAALGGRGQEGDNAQRAGHAREAASAAGRLRRRAGASMRLLHQRLDHDRRRLSEEESQGGRRRAARCARRPEMPLRHARRDPARDQARPNADGLEETTMNAPLSRREFLKASGALIVTAAGPALVGEALAQGAAPKPALVPTELDSWVAVAPDGRVTAFFGKMDMGQSLDVAIAQIVADELDVAVDKVDVVMGDTALTCNQGGASGSTGIYLGARPLRNASAEARRLLVQAASQKLGVPAEQLRVHDGMVSSIADPSRKASYAELIGGRYFNHQVEWNKETGNPMDIKVQAKVKSPSEYRVVGKSFARRDLPGKVYRTEKYVTDVSLPKMLHARVIRPTRAACTLASVDERSIKKVKGARVVREKDFVAVVADHEWDAVRGPR